MCTIYMRTILFGTLELNGGPPLVLGPPGGGAASVPFEEKEIVTLDHVSHISVGYESSDLCLMQESRSEKSYLRASPGAGSGPPWGGAVFHRLHRFQQQTRIASSVGYAHGIRGLGHQWPSRLGPSPGGSLCVYFLTTYQVLYITFQ